MFLDNHVYGHAELLWSFVKASGSAVQQGGDNSIQSPMPIVPGRLQHGWVEDTQFTPSSRRLIPLFVWNSRTEALHKAADDRRVTAIGAPFLYLLARLGQLPDGPSPPSPGTGVLAVPMHAHPRAPVALDHNAYAQLLHSEGLSTATVCLSVGDMHNPLTVAVYREAGFPVVSVGQRSDPLFLVRQLSMLTRYASVVSNRPSTALWYAGVLARGIRLVGTAPGRLEPRPGVPGSPPDPDRWPGLRDGLAPLAAASLAGCELGLDRMRPADDLCELFGWTSGVRPLRNAALRLGEAARVQATTRLTALVRRRN